MTRKGAKSSAKGGFCSFFEPGPPHDDAPRRYHLKVTGLVQRKDKMVPTEDNASENIADSALKGNTLLLTGSRNLIHVQGSMLTLQQPLPS